MRSRQLLLTLLATAALGVLAACGTPGAPQPPSLELPRRVEDLKATRKADKVWLAWTPPLETTDRTRIKHMGISRVCRGINAVAMDQCAQAVGELQPGQLPAPAKAGFTDVLPEELQERSLTGFATYAVETQNARGRSAGLGNQVRVPLAPTLAPPPDLKAQVTPEGVELSWSGMLHEHDAENRLRHLYRVFRRTAGKEQETVVGEVALEKSLEARLLDRNIEWESRYQYKVTAVTVVPTDGQPAEVEGVDSPYVEVFVHDVFPPGTPTGLQAVFSGLAQQKFIDLAWAPNTESDLAGYNVYRREEGGPAARINSERVTTPSFRDSNVAAGHRYSYAVSAVDLRGNESGRSDEASEQVPQ